MHIVPEQSSPARQASVRPLSVPPLPSRRGGVVTPRLHLVGARNVGSTAPAIADAANGPTSQRWAHPSPAAFPGRIREVADLVGARVTALPPRLVAGPLGCATAHNVREFRELGQADRAWRLAARLVLRADDDGHPGCQDTIDLAISALLLAVHEGGCVLAALEAAAMVDRLLAETERPPLRHAGLRLEGPALAAHLRARRMALLDLAVTGAGAPAGSPASVEALMHRAPLLPRRKAQSVPAAH